MVLTGFIRDLRQVLPNVRMAAVSNKPVSVTITGKISPHVYTASIFGRTIRVKSGLNLLPNSTLQARVSLRGNTVLLKTLPQENFPRDTSGIRGTGPAALQEPLVKSAASALMRAGMPLTPQFVDAVMAFARRFSLKDAGALRLSAQFADKGIFPGEGEFERFRDYIFPASSGGNDMPGGYGRPDDEQQREGGNDENEEIDAIMEKLKSRIVPVENPEDPLLAMLNHVQGLHDNWVLIPFSLRGEAADFRGTIRLKIGRDIRSIESLVVSLARETETWHFAVPKFREKPSTLKFYMSGNRTEKIDACLSVFRENIAKQNLILDDSIGRSRNFDGFSDIVDEVPENIDYEA
ncbi:MAG: hypothetical protein E4H36_01080 [Spirochaetales bacterium]|nr:MAG: hypothetical protein E4H36_01080 [Spirochaetales bacterium]